MICMLIAGLIHPIIVGTITMIVGLCKLMLVLCAVVYGGATLAISSIAVVIQDYIKLVRARKALKNKR